MRKRIVGGVLVAVAGLFLLTAARADEEKVPLDKLPKAVVDTIDVVGNKIFLLTRPGLWLKNAGKTAGKV